MINIKNISFSYVSTPVFKDFSLKINQGEFVALTGGNGSGKSTLARLLNGLLTPQSGNILIDGADTSDASALYKIRSTAALVFQNPDDQLISAVVEDEAAFGAENLGLAPHEIRIRVDEALSIAGLSDKALCSTAHLSGGEKQRLAIAGALVMKPKILILDEATSMLDPSGRNKILQTIKELHKNGMTVLMITHSMDEAALADRCIVIDNGNVVLDGTPAEIFSNAEKLRKLSLDIPDMKLLALHLCENGVSVPDTIFDVKSMADFLELYLQNGELK